MLSVIWELDIYLHFSALMNHLFSYVLCLTLPHMFYPSGPRILLHESAFRWLDAGFSPQPQIQSWVTSCETNNIQNGIGAGFFSSFLFPLLIICPPLLYFHLSLSSELCSRSGHTAFLKTGGFIHIPYLAPGCSQNKEVNLGRYFGQIYMTGVFLNFHNE
jgi:hypothetical protein